MNTRTKLKAETIGIARIKYAAAFIILLAIEVLIALYVHDTIIRPYVGDILVVIVLYFGLRIIWPVGIKLLPVYIFIFAALVECLQLAGLVNILNVQSNTFLRILIGSVFDLKDIICYAIGCILIYICKWISNKIVKMKGEN